VTYDDFELVIGVNMWGVVYGRQDRADEPGSRGGDRERHDAER